MKFNISSQLESNRFAIAGYFPGFGQPGLNRSIGFIKYQRLGKYEVGDKFNVTDIRVLRPADIGLG
jgi:hypothetical protein